MSNNTMQAALYYVNISLFESLNNEEIVNHIVEEYNDSIKDDSSTEPFTEQPMKDDILELGDFKIKVFFSTKKRIPAWRDFWEPVLDKDADLFKKKNRYVSYVAFFYDDEEIFALTGGQGNFLIQKYVDSSFGIKILARLISKESKAIKSLSEKGLMGGILASTKFYRFDYRIIDEDDFGKFFKQITVILDPDKLNRIGYSPEDLKNKVACVAKSTFQVKKSISFEKLVASLQGMKKLLNEPSMMELNQIIKISRRNVAGKKLVKKLECKLSKIFLEKYSKDDLFIDYELCPSDFENFLTANTYMTFYKSSKKPIFKSENADVLDILFGSIKEKGAIIGTVENMQEFISALQIKSFDSDNKILTSSSFFKHLHGELNFEGKNYFIVEGEWYEIKSDFLEKLNSECKITLDECLDNNKILNKNWDIGKSENDYNFLYCNEPNFLVFDKVLIENIEICDLLKYDSDNVYLIHVKKGFNNTIRSLVSQIEIAARAVNEAIKSNSWHFFEMYYQNLKNKLDGSHYFNKIAEQTETIKMDQFVDLFKKKPVFCIAFYDDAKTKRNIKEISLFKSNIAKYSLVGLSRFLNMQGLSFKIIQIK